MAKNIRLRILRAERDWSQSKAARRARLSFNRYWRIENGEAEPSAGEQRRIARAFRVPLEQAFSIEPREVAS